MTVTSKSGARGARGTLAHPLRSPRTQQGLTAGVQRLEESIQVTRCVSFARVPSARRQERDTHTTGDLVTRLVASRGPAHCHPGPTQHLGRGTRSLGFQASG